MADQPTIPSGSRWEPDPDTTADKDRAGESAASEPPPAPPLDDPASQERRAQLRGRAILAGAATALALGGGLTGFVIGHSTAGDDNGFRPANFRHGPDDGQQFGNQPPGFDRDGSDPRNFEDDGTGSTGTGT